MGGYSFSVLFVSFKVRLSLLLGSFHFGFGNFCLACESDVDEFLRVCGVGRCPIRWCDCFV